MENNKAKSDDNSVSIEFIQDFITASTDVINLSYENFRKNFYTQMSTELWLNKAATPKKTAQPRKQAICCWLLTTCTAASRTKCYPLAMFGKTRFPRLF